MSTTGGIRGLVGKLFGRDGLGKADPFSEAQSFAFSEVPPLLQNDVLSQLQEALGYQIRNDRIFVQALMHRSYLQLIEGSQVESNERLEFLGDSILNMLIGEFLFRHYRDEQEGDLTKLRSRLVNKKALIHGAHAVGLERFVFLNTSAEQSLRQGNKSIIADAFEAVIAAIYIDSGMDLRPVKGFLRRTILASETFEKILETDENYKSALLELVQARGHDAPRYEVVAEEGPDHERSFTVEVWVGGRTLGSGEGRSKKKAEQAAARIAISNFK